MKYIPKELALKHVTGFFLLIISVIENISDMYVFYSKNAFQNVSYIN